jgi:hypothetical protein
VFEAGIAGRQAASRYLQAFVSSGLLREQESGREKLFVNSRLLTLLTAETDAVEPFRSAPQGRWPRKNPRSFQPRGFFK